MRITNSMLVNNFMRNLNTNLTKMDKLQNQLATGRKFAHISDDPTALIYSQAARNKIARLSHYQRTIGSAKDWLTQSEFGVMELQKAISSANEATIDAATSVKTQADRINLAKVIAQYRDHFVDTLNTTFGDKYVFGGYNTPGEPADGFLTKGIKPFTVGDVGSEKHLFYNGFDLSQFDGMTLADFNDYIKSPAGAPEQAAFQELFGDVLIFDVGPGISMPVTMNGIELVLFTTTRDDGVTIIRNAFNVLDELNNLCIDFEKPIDELSKMLTPLQDAQNHLLTKTAEIGGRNRRLELLEARYEQDAINYESMKSDAEDVDMAEIIMFQKMAEAVYQAALSSGARIIQPTLMDFLR